MADAQNNQKNQQQDLNQILKVRREKLAALQEAGKDPFRHVKYDVHLLSVPIIIIAARTGNKSTPCTAPPDVVG